MKLYLIVILSFFSFSFLNIYSIKKENIKVVSSKGRIIVPFKENSFKLSDAIKRDLDSLIMSLNENQELVIRKIELNPITCKAEIKKDMFLGVKRAKVISSYLESRWNLKLDTFCIIEDSYFEETCNTVGVNMGFIFASK
jgi:hypothetical protein